MVRSEVKSLRKALSILNVVSVAERPLSIANIAQNAGITRPTAYRIVQTLLSEGFVKEDLLSGTFSIGYSALPLAASALDRDQLRREAMPHLEKMAHQIGERVNLGVLYNDRVLYLGGIEKPTLPSIYSRFGRTVPAHCSSLGKAILAQQSDDTVTSLLKRAPLTAQTPTSITSLPDFMQELKLTRERGYAVDNEENAMGSFCIGVPLFSKERVVGAISASARSYEAVAEGTNRLREAAEQISHKI